jgi:hypothetical protein
LRNEVAVPLALRKPAGAWQLVEEAEAHLSSLRLVVSLRLNQPDNTARPEASSDELSCARLADQRAFARCCLQRVAIA